MTATIVSQVGPDEWELVIEDEAAGEDDGTLWHAVVFRDAGEIRMP